MFCSFHAWISTGQPFGARFFDFLKTPTMSKDYTDDFRASQDTPPTPPSWFDKMPWPHGTYSAGQNDTFSSPNIEVSHSMQKPSQGEEFTKFQQLARLLHRGGEAAYLWQCSEIRKPKKLKSGIVVWNDAAFKTTIWKRTIDEFSHPPEKVSGYWVHTYFGVHPTNKIGNRWQRTAKNVTDKSPYVVAVNCVFAEFDAKDFDNQLKTIAEAYKAHLRAGHPPETFNAAESKCAWQRGMKAALQAIEQVPIRPTAIINSGGGYHGYWIFVKPILLSNLRIRNQVDRLQKAFVEAVGSDGGAKDLARVLRVPGTHNQKHYYEHGPLMASIKCFNPGQLYSQRQIEECIQSLQPNPHLLPQTQRKIDFIEPRQESKSQPEFSKAKGAEINDSHEASSDANKARHALTRLSAQRCDTYLEWLQVGMALHQEFNAASWALSMWDEWSKQSSKYSPGVTEMKWATFKYEENGNLGLGSLIKWANEDVAHNAPLQGKSFDLVINQLKAIAALADVPKEHRQTQMRAYLIDIISSCAHYSTDQIEHILLIIQSHLSTKEADRFRVNINKKRQEINKIKIKEEEERKKQRLASDLATMKKDLRLAGRSLVDLADFDLYKLTEDVITILTQHNQDRAFLFTYGSMLSRVSDGNLQSDLTTNQLTYEVVKRIKFIKTSFTHGIKNMMPPEKMINLILGRGAWPEFPPLKAVVKLPYVSEDGRLITKNGFDPETGIYLDCDLKLPKQIQVSTNNLNASIAYLKSLLDDYPFCEDGSKTNALSYMLLPFLRPYIDDICPLALADAPKAGTGKTHLMKMIYMLVYGKSLPTMNVSKITEEELNKTVTGLLMSGSTHVLFDNLTGFFGSSTIEGLLTTDMFQSRILGGNKLALLPNNMIAFATANNLQMSPDMTTRVTFINLDANLQDPSKRHFQNKYASRDARKNKALREKVVEASLICVQHWINENMYHADLKHRFPKWADVMGGLMSILGMDDFLANHELMKEIKDPATEAWSIFCWEWWQKWGNQPVRATDLLDLASHRDGMDAENPLYGMDLLGELEYKQGGVTADREKGRQRQLGNHLKKQLNQVYGQFKIVSAKNKKGKSCYALTHVS